MATSPRKAYSIAAARDRLAELVHEAERGAPVRLTRRGTPVAVLVSAEDYDALVRPSKGFWQALEQFRREDGVGLSDEELEVLAGHRDRSPGRKVRL